MVPEGEHSDPKLSPKLPLKLSEKIDPGDSLTARILNRKYLHLRGLPRLLICSKGQLAQTPCWPTPMEQLVLDQFSSAIWVRIT